MTSHLEYNAPVLGNIGSPSGQSHGPALDLNKAVDDEPNESSDEYEVIEYPNTWAKIRSEYVREAAGEFFGIFILVLFGNGVNCQAGLSGHSATSAAPAGDPASVALAWGAGLAMGVWVAAGISGGHINPAVTLTMAIFRGFPWRKVPVFIFAQILGAWAAAIVVYANYFHAINLVEGGHRTLLTAGYFGAYALDYVPAANAFFDEYIATFVLVFVILAVTDKRNGSPAGLLPLAIFIVFIGITAAFGMQTAFACNPARDFGPRVMTAMVGYGRAVFTYRSGYFFWCTTCGPIAGALTAGLMYDVLICTGSESIFNRPNASARMRQGKGTSGHEHRRTLADSSLQV